MTQRDRKYPSFTLPQLKDMVSQLSDADVKSAMQAEIEAREAGRSVPGVTPQVAWRYWR